MHKFSKIVLAIRNVANGCSASKHYKQDYKCIGISQLYTSQFHYPPSLSVFFSKVVLLLLEMLKEVKKLRTLLVYVHCPAHQKIRERKLGRLLRLPHMVSLGLRAAVAHSFVCKKWSVARIRTCSHIRAFVQRTESIFSIFDVFSLHLRRPVRTLWKFI